MEINCIKVNCKQYARKFKKELLYYRYCSKHFKFRNLGDDDDSYIDKIELIELLSDSFTALEKKRIETFRKINRTCLITIEKIRQKTKEILEKVTDSFKSIKEKIENLELTKITKYIDKVEIWISDEPWLDKIEHIFLQSISFPTSEFPRHENEKKISNQEKLDSNIFKQDSTEHNRRSNQSRFSNLNQNITENYLIQEKRNSDIEKSISVNESRSNTASPSKSLRGKSNLPPIKAVHKLEEKKENEIFRISANDLSSEESKAHYFKKSSSKYDQEIMPASLKDISRNSPDKQFNLENNHRNLPNGRASIDANTSIKKYMIGHFNN